MTVIPESIVKKRKAAAERKVKGIQKKIENRQKSKAKSIEIFKRAIAYNREYQGKEQKIINLKRDARKAGNYYVPAEPRLAFVVRIRG